MRDFLGVQKRNPRDISPTMPEGERGQTPLSVRKYSDHEAAIIECAADRKDGTASSRSADLEYHSARYGSQSKPAKCWSGPFGSM